MPAQPNDSDDPHSSVISRVAWPIALALAAAHVGLGWLTRASQIFSDQAVYVCLAEALRHFHYRELFSVGEPVHRMYPPGYPFLLAIWSAIGNDRLDWLVVVGLLCSAGALLLVFAAVRNIWGPVIALACLLALTPNPSLVRTSGWLLSEPPFMFFASLALWSLSRAREPRRNAVVAGVAAIAAALIRTAGVALVIAVFAYWLWQRQLRRAVIFGVMASAIVGGWLVFTALAAEQVPGRSYIADAVVRPRGVSLPEALLERISQKLPYAQHVYWELPAPGIAGTNIDSVVGAPLVAVALITGTWLLSKRWKAAAVYLAAYGALLAVWPWTLGRFLTPVMPWVVVAALVGVHGLVSIARIRWHTAAVIGAASILAISGLMGTMDVVRQRQHPDQHWADFFQAVEHMRGRVPADAVLLSPAPATLYLHTGLRTLTLPLAATREPSAFLAFLHNHGVGYVLLSPVGPGPAQMVKANCRHVQLEASFSSAYLFRVGDGENLDGSAACDAVERFIEDR